MANIPEEITFNTLREKMGKEYEQVICRRETQMLKKKREMKYKFLKYMYIILHSSDSF